MKNIVLTKTTTMSLLMLCMLFFAGKSMAQQTMIYTEDDKGYKYALELYQKQKYTAAKQAFKKYIATQYMPKVTPNANLFIEDAHYYEAACAAALEQDDAKFLLASFIDLFPSNNKSDIAKYQLGKLYFNDKEYDKALPYLQQVDQFSLDPNQRAELRFIMAYSYFTKKNYGQAKSIFREFKNQQNKYSDAASYYLGYIAYEQKDYDEAITAFRKVENSKAYASVAPMHITAIYYQEKQYDELLEYAIPLSNSPRIRDVEVLNHLIGQTYYQKESFGDAIPYLEKFCRAGRNVADDDYYMLGYAAYKQGDYKTAISAFKYIASKPSKIGQNASYLMAESHLRLKEKPEARNAFKEASKEKFDPEIQELAAFNYAKMSYEMNYHQVSLTALQDFIKTYPRSDYNDDARELLGEVLLSTKNYKQAVEIMEGLSNKNQTSKKVYQKVAYYRGVELFNEKNYLDAINLFNKSIDNAVDQKYVALANFWKAEAAYTNKNYSSAKVLFNRFLSSYEPGFNLESENSPIAANYGLGYCYFNNQEYKQAQDAFRNASKLIKSSPTSIRKSDFVNEIYPDLTLRLADVSFASKDYASATQYYDEIIDQKLPGSDYALFQKAVVFGLKDQDAQKINTYKQLISGYSQSPYVDDAYMQLANHYFLKEDYASALNELDNLVRKQSSSAYITTAYVTRGLIYYNQRQYDKALEAYKYVAENYAGTPDGQDALLAIKDIYVAKNDVDAYFKYVKNKNFKNVDISDARQEELAFKAVKRIYDQGDCSNSLLELNKFLRQYPSGVYLDNARFLRGDCNFAQRNKEEALKDFEAILSSNKVTDVTELTLAYASDILYEQKAYKKALDYYERLQNMSSAKRNLLAAYRGSIICGFETSEFTKCAAAANKLINYVHATENDKNLARLYKGKIALNERKYSEAKQLFTDVYKGDKNEQAAEAKYRIAEIEYREAKYEDSNETVFEMSERLPNYENWLGRGFVLVAKNYIKLDNLFQAKATLESVIENVVDKDIKADAQNLLDEVNKKIDNNG